MKKYVEPMMVVEDFELSEMIAANCSLDSGDFKVVQQMSLQGCASGYEGDKGVHYANLSEYFRDFFEDFNNDGSINNGDLLFTAAYHQTSEGDVCNYDPFEHGMLFNEWMNCGDDSSVLVSS